MSTFGERLRDLRKGKNLTQKELGNKFKLSESAIGMYERNDRTPSQDLTRDIADFFEVSTDYLLGRTDSLNAQVSNSGTGGRAYYGGGKDWTEDEKAAADAFIETLRKRKQAEQKKK